MQVSTAWQTVVWRAERLTDLPPPSAAAFRGRSSCTLSSRAGWWGGCARRGRCAACARGARWAGVQAGCRLPGRMHGCRVASVCFAQHSPGPGHYPPPASTHAAALRFAGRTSNLFHLLIITAGPGRHLHHPVPVHQPPQGAPRQGRPAQVSPWVLGQVAASSDGRVGSAPGARKQLQLQPRRGWSWPQPAPATLTNSTALPPPCSGACFAAGRRRCGPACRPQVSPCRHCCRATQVGAFLKTCLLCALHTRLVHACRSLAVSQLPTAAACLHVPALRS